jgi:hypothetical protein
MIGILFAIENTLNNRILGAPRRWLERTLRFWLPVLIIAGVLLLSAALPFRASQRQLTLLLGLIPALVAVLVFIRWPPLGVIALIMASLIAPSPRLPGGFNIAVLLLIALIGLWLLDMLVRQGDVASVPSRTVWPLLALIVVACLSFGVGQLPWFSFVQPAALDAQIGGLAIFILAAGAFLLVAHQVRDLRWLQRMTWLFLALGALVIAGWLIPGAGRFTGRLFQRGATANSMFWTWLVALAFGQMFFNKRLHPGWRLALGGLVVATMYVAYFQNFSWKSGYLPPLVAIAAMVGFRSWPAGLALALAGYVPAQYLGSQAITTEEYSYGTRIDAWRIMLNMIKVNPILGFGPANYYWYTRLFPIRGYYVVFNSHNQYLDIIAQTGLLGLACVLWFAWEVGRLGWRLRTQVPEGFARAYVYGALGGLAGTLAAGMLVDWFLPFVYNIGLNGFRGGMLPWLFLGGLVSIEQIVRRQAPAQAPDNMILPKE